MSNIPGYSKLPTQLLLTNTFNNSIKMKLSILPIFLLLTVTGFSQIQNSTEKFRITQFMENGKNVTKDYKGRQQYIMFFKNEKNELCFEVGSLVANEKSYGLVYLTQPKEEIQTKDNCSAETMNFRWKYHNSYDSTFGYATNTFTKIFTEPIVSFRFRMATQELDVFEYSGYMEIASNYADETELAKR